jgi:signal transduction histidine kinase
LKLLTKTTLFFLTISFFILFLGGILFYFLFRSIVYKEINQELTADMHQLILHSPKNDRFGADSILFDLPIHYKIVPIKTISNPKFIFHDTLFFDNIMKHYQSYRMLTYQTDLNGNAVQISISKSLLISDELIEKVALATLLLSLLLLLGIYIFNNYFFSRIWGNFFKTVNVIKDYNISNKSEIELPESEIQEFDLLNQGLQKMHSRIKQDFQNLKEFIENISHEIQTPLAIIKSKVDLLQQSEKLDQSQFELIQSIQSSAIRLSNLNKSLILLSRIDNNQFPERIKVGINEIIETHLYNFEDIINSKNISLQKDFQNSLYILADADLISIMILNLLKNSIYHNLPSGTVKITVNSNSLSIKNSGKELDIMEEDIFKRFTKSSNKKDSLGLGLAIVKKICDFYHYQVFYSYHDYMHCITITFC